jgi:hypothetical protein
MAKLTVWKSAALSAVKSETCRSLVSLSVSKKAVLRVSCWAAMKAGGWVSKWDEAVA